MFGTMTVSTVDLNDDEKERYRQLYCGLCRALKTRGGERCRTCLTYDLTFLVMLYHSLYEPEEEQGRQRCLMSPHKSRAFTTSKYIDYAADLSIALAYHKLDDNWRDEHALKGRAGMMLLSKPYREVCERIPDECKAIEQACDDMFELEQDANTSPDAVANRFGELLTELFIFEDDLWQDTLSQLANALGRFIYFMDAVVDFEDNVKLGGYNPLIANNITLDTAREALFDLMGQATQAFEKLPLEQDLHILRSVLYGGAWSTYCNKYGQPVEIMGCAEENCDDEAASFALQTAEVSDKTAIGQTETVRETSERYGSV